MDEFFKGKRALVTGAGQGIGRAIAIELAKLGADVVAISRTPQHLAELERQVPSIKTVVLDISLWESTAYVVSNLLPIDLLVNNAGVTSLQPVGEVSEDEINRVFSVNVKAAINISQIVAKDLRSRGVPGSIVNISSQASMVALHDHLVYCTSKAALDQITKVMALEMGPHKIRVNSVNPTIVLTEMGKKAWGEPAKADPMKAKIPLGQFCGPQLPGLLIPTIATMHRVNDNTVVRAHVPCGDQPYHDITIFNFTEDALDIKEPQDVVNAVVFLLSNKASMITGTNLPIDGGYLIQ